MQLSLCTLTHTFAKLSLQREGSQASGAEVGRARVASSNIPAGITPPSSRFPWVISLQINMQQDFKKSFWEEGMG